MYLTLFLIFDCCQNTTTIKLSQTPVFIYAFFDLSHGITLRYMFRLIESSSSGTIVF
jgi:hypothetical protein